MPRFPYMNFPFPAYKSPYKLPSGFYKAQESTINSKKANSAPVSPSNSNRIPRAECIDLKPNDTDKKNKSNNNTGDYLFDLFGLKIYSDDVLLVSLIYFLYSEGVKDDGLFLVLVLLLLS